MADCDKTLYIVMPAYNEFDNIPDVLAEWYPILKCGNANSKLVIAPAGSADGTGVLLHELSQSELPNLVVLKDTDRQHGPKVLALYRYAILQGADWVFQTDSDGQTRANEFYAFWDLRNQYDVILGERTERGDGKSRAIVERVLCKYLRVFFSVNVPDANAPFRLMRTDTVKKYLHLMPEDYNIPNAVLTACFARYKEKMTFIPISFAAREKGVNSINLRRIAGIGMKAIADFFKIKASMREFEKG